MSTQLAAFLIVAVAGVALSVYLFSLYQEADEVGQGTRWVDRWSFVPQDLGGFSYQMLVLVSVLGLFIELLLIRWVSSEIRIFAYFKNFVLIACFLGFGLGFHFCRRRIQLLAAIVPLFALCLLIQLPWPALRGVIRDLPLLLGVFSEVHIWGIPALDFSAGALLNLGAAMVISVPIFALVSLVFVPLGQLLGRYLGEAPHGIFGYTVDVLASLAGILLFTLLSFLYQPPIVWLGVAGAGLVLLLWKRPILRWTSLTVLVACLSLLSLREHPGSTVHWSPYQKLSLTPIERNGELTAYSLLTNSMWYQEIVDLSPEFVASHPGFLLGVPIEFNAYNLPYRFFPDPPSVLVLGAGMGNDVAAALRNGAQRVVAVEIDPLILELGREFHFERPYDSSRVEVLCDDARSYVQGSTEQFDLIVFALLDSHTTASHFSNIRIDNYVYTIEAIRAARRLLKPSGVFIVKFQVDHPWIAARLQKLLTNVFGSAPLELQAEQTHGTSGRFFFSSFGRNLARSLEDEELRSYVGRRAIASTVPVTMTTDDWPYFYQQQPGLPASVIAVSLVLVLLCGIALRGTGLQGRSIEWHFFSLGAGFMLLETQIVSKMALLFGTTWLTNSLVISAILLVIVSANMLVERLPWVPVRPTYLGLGGAILLTWLIPMQWLFLDPVWLRAGVAAAVLCLPVFFASIIFIDSFAKVNFRGPALGSNLLGALIGGMLESISLWTGIRSLLVVTAVLYLASYLLRSGPSGFRETLQGEGT
jgi:spermidine synthase